MKIVFGGTFDPPHRGHLACIVRALAYFPAAQVLVVPARVPGAVSGLEKTPGASFTQRVAMCRLLIQALSQAERKRVAISTIEEKLPVPNYTVTTLEALKNNDVVLLLGEDQLTGFAGWKDPARILELASLAVVGRESAQLRSIVDKVMMALKLHITWAQDGSQGKIAETGTSLYLLGASGSEAASSKLRQQGQTREALFDQWLTQDVREYVAQQQLYVGKQS